MAWRLGVQPLKIRNRDRGFTVIELMITLVVLAVLATIAVPSFEVFLEKSSLSSAASEMHAAISRSRQEAISRGTFVSIIAKDGSSWASGYRIFVNPLHHTTYTSGDTLGTGTSSVTSQELALGAPSAWNYVTWPTTASDTSAAITCVTFDDLGRPIKCDGSTTIMASGKIKICTAHAQCSEITVDALGRIQIQALTS
jgi:prepilin-type N-terminal cleavage/methylation domain-containing protein